MGLSFFPSSAIVRTGRVAYFIRIVFWSGGAPLAPIGNVSNEGSYGAFGGIQLSEIEGLQFTGNPPEGVDPGIKMGLLPRAVYQMCVHGALIVGSFAKWMIDGNGNVRPNDIDLLVPPEKWGVVSLLIPTEGPNKAQLNKFGGWRFLASGVEVDVWPDTLQSYLTQCRAKFGAHVCAVDFIHNRVFTTHQQELKL